jgi:hypothetical protein
MDYHIVEARYVAGHVVWLRFRDGTSGEIDLAPALRGPIFEPLRIFAGRIHKVRCMRHPRTSVDASKDFKHPR